MSSSAAASPSDRPRPAWREAARRAPVNMFAFVMATGILSTVLAESGAAILSRVLLAVAVTGFAVLLPLAVLRVVLHPRLAVADAQDPAKAVGYFTLVAALGVCATRPSPGDASTWPVALAAAALPVWVFLVYAGRPA